ncbi:hypothetical protein [Paenibacillus sp. V4I7]|uniref:hypothetical protein n=1 Tax=Paenibacillus sp. V4I7 TaxID=3042307 RepID=UPI00278669F8|nr:hypothetical protein [Paenibacillus sp. V4I7]MDQ0903096.1 CubicO group peptidase (beta-lactamase class C family) [Paenibacillus sp. V4I7]
MNKQFTACMSEKRIRRWTERPNHQLTVGLVHHSTRSIWTSGQGNGVDSSKFLYEIGSITKTMTGPVIGNRRAEWRLASFRPAV